MSSVQDRFIKENKKHILFCFVFASLFLFAQNANATLYAPGTTLEPDCPPTDSLSTCGVSTSTQAASGANSDITSLSGLITALAPSEGGTGISLYNPDDLLYALSPGTLATLGIGTSGQVLTVSASGTPAWSAGSSPNIGSSDLTLAGNRTLSFNGNSLDFHGTSGDVTFDNAGDVSASGNLTVTGTSTLPGPFVTTKTPDYITTGTQNNVYFGYGSVTDYAGSAPATFTGMAAGVDGEQKRVSNHSSSNIFFTDQDANSVAADRIITTTGGALTVPPNVSIDFQYDGPAAKWQVTGLTATAATIGTFGFIQNGNAFGTAAILGTTDANPLSFITSGANRFTIATTSATFTGTGATSITTNNSLSLSSAAANALTITSGTTGALTLDSGTTGNIAIGSSTNAKIITIGNTTGATSVNINTGTGGLNVTGNAIFGNASTTNLSIANALYVGGLSTTSNGIVNTQTKYQIAGADVLSSNTLGSGILNSSLTSLGTLGILNVSGTSTLATTSVSAFSLGDNVKSALLAVDANGNVIATSTANLFSNYPTYAYASSTFASTTYVNNNFPTLIYASSSFLSLVSAATDYVSTSTLTTNYVPYTYATATFEVLSDKSTSTVLGTSNILYPTQNAVKTYVDNIATGLIWQNPVQVINLIGDASAPVGSPNNDDAYIINTGGNTGAWSGFAAGDLVQYQTTSWVKIKSLATGDYMGIDFLSTSTPSGSMTGKKNYIVEITGGTPGVFTYTFTAPANNDAVFVSNVNAFYHNISFTYSSSLTQWVQLSATTNYVFGSGLNTSGLNISLGNLTSDWNQIGVYNIDTAGKIGIGTTTPATALSVSGTSTMKGLNISNLANAFLAVDVNGNVIATSTANLLSNYITLAYASSTYASTTYVTNTFLPLSASTSLSYIPLSASTSLSYIPLSASTSLSYIPLSASTSLSYIPLSASTSYLTVAAATSTYMTFAYASSTYASTSFVTANYIPYTGATSNVNLGSNTFTVSGQATLGNLSIAGNLVTPKAANYSTTGIQNNVSLGPGYFFDYTGNGAATFTGIVAGSDGQEIRIVNDSAFNLILSNQNASSTAANRIITASNGDITVAPDVSFALLYDAGVSRWRIVTLPASPASISTYAFEQNGNAFGATANLGTTDANPLTFLTSGANRFTIATTSATFTGSGATTITANNSLSLTSAAASDLDITSGTTGNLNLDSGTTGNISIGSSTNAKTIFIGNGTGATSLIFNAGTGNIEIGTNAVARTVNLGDAAAVVEAINIGGTGANVIGIGNTQVGGSIAIGGALTTGTIDIGNSNGAMTGTINVGGSTGAQILNFGAGNTGIKTINIGNGTAGNTISIGNGVNASAQVLNIADGAAGANSTVNILSGVATAGTQTLNLGTGASGKIINIGNTTDATTLTFDSGTGGITLLTGTTGNVSITSGTTGSVTLDSGTTGTVNLGTGNNAKTINIGTGTAGNAINIGTNNTTADTIGIGSALDTVTIGGTLIVSNPTAAAAGNLTLCINNATKHIFLGAAQNACNPSSERFKNDITDLTMGLETIDALRPVNYYYDSGTTALQNGLIAEEVYPLIPEAVVLDDQGLPAALDYSQITPVMIKAIQEQSLLMGDTSLQVSSTTDATSTDNDLSTFVSTVQSEVAPDPDVVIGDKIASGVEFLVDFVSARVTAIRGYFDEIFAKQVHTNEICVTKSDGTEVCLTGDQLQAIMNDNNINNTSSSLAPTETQIPSSPDDSPQIATTTEASSSDASDSNATTTADALPAINNPAATSTDVQAATDDSTSSVTDTVPDDASSTGQ